MKNEQTIMKEILIVSARQMREIESRIFERGMPVSALMEKAAGLCFQKIIALYPLSKVARVGVIVGSGHNWWRCFSRSA
jgi:ADP-dependent NAD(P)H-hydrate dehydratase / NAD(P)H-hydrate epimerase